MRAARCLALLAFLGSCSGSPTGGGEPELLPTGTILAASPNFPEHGSYLVDVATGAVTQLAMRDDPFQSAWQGGYSDPDRLVYGVRVESPTDRVVGVSLASQDTVLLAAMPDLDHLLGAIRLSPDGRTLAAQTWRWRIDKIELVLIDLATEMSTQLVDQSTMLDAVPLASIRWGLDGRDLYAVTEVNPDRTELVRVDLLTGRFEILSSNTRTGYPLWIDISPDGRAVAHADGTGALRFRDIDGHEIGGYPEVLPPVRRPTWSPDGRFLAYQEIGPEGEGDIIMMRLSDGKRWPLEIEGDLKLWLVDWIPEGVM